MRASSSYGAVSTGSGSSHSIHSISAEKRARVSGKYVVRGADRLYVKGVTYGTFRPSQHDRDYPAPAVVQRDFQQMRSCGINTVRLYSAPPRWLLDAAADNGLAVIVGLPWSQHTAFLSDAPTRRSIRRQVDESTRQCAGHPALLAVVVGNEIPAQVVRWHGARQVERFLGELYQTVKLVDPEALVTYANFPSTEYLNLPFTDFEFINLYLESQRDFAAYLARLHSRSSAKPLIIAELGLDSRRHGAQAQAQALFDQVSTAFAKGCAGVCVFAWTDEWHRGGFDVHDWDFGLTERQRRPKPALAAVTQAFAQHPPPDARWPRFSVVVCSYNGAATIGECLARLARLEYHNYEVIVVNDGSTDATASIAVEFDVQLITTSNRGLSHARNVGLGAATGEIVAYIDDDAWPDPDWLTQLAHMFLSTPHAAVGGPNVAPLNDGFVAEAVDRSPGNPVHVLLGDELAEHIPGCNMAIRRPCLEAIGGFDERFRVAGDDVDLCWRLQERGWTIGFSPAALVWHHRRRSVRAYWRQQIGYGRAEALLERKWPDKYNGLGHLVWQGRVYSNGTPQRPWRRQRVYHGRWGEAAYQMEQEDPPGKLAGLLSMPEWYVVLGVLLLLTSLIPLWSDMAMFMPVLLAAATTTIVHAALSVDDSRSDPVCGPKLYGHGLRGLATFLHLLQPLARLNGRVSNGLTPWRHRSTWGYAWPRRQRFGFRSTEWRSTGERLTALHQRLLQAGYGVRCGNPYEPWDLEIQGGAFAATRIQALVEEHGWGKQFIRFRCWQRYSTETLIVIGCFGLLAAAAAYGDAWAAAVILGSLSLTLLLLVLRAAAGSAAAARSVIVGESQTSADFDQAGATGFEVECTTPPGVVHVAEPAEAAMKTWHGREDGTSR